MAQSGNFNEGLVNVVQQYVKKGANVYIEGALSTRKWKDEATGPRQIFYRNSSTGL